MFSKIKTYTMTGLGEYYINDKRVSKLRYLISKFFNKKHWLKTDLEHK